MTRPSLLALTAAFARSAASAAPAQSDREVVDTIVARSANGAGTIQTVLPLPADQGALVITTARAHRARRRRHGRAGGAGRLDSRDRRLRLARASTQIEGGIR